ncbi:MAG: hypothetical protein M3Z16_03250 [Pseudomonadota bacterium]|nr:hypothetical protein [Pseudomonadota bacterium]
MESGKIRLQNTGGTSPEGYTQTICQAINNRLYRITNDGNGADTVGPEIMRIRITRNFLWFTVSSYFELSKERSLDVFGSTIVVEALQDLQLFGSYDTI